jgi:zinc protease
MRVKMTDLGPENITRVVLDNGIVVLSRAAPASPSVSISGFLPAGGLLDPDDKLGLADFTASALVRGAGERSFQEIFEILESAGASLGFSGGVHSMGFSGRSLAEDLPLLLDLLSNALRRPHFPLEPVERLRALLLAGLTIRAQSTEDVASLLFDQMVYANHPYSRPEDGYPETVQAITRDDLAAFHQKNYGPGGMVVALVGGLDPQQMVAAVAQVLGDWRNPEQPPKRPLPPLTPLAKGLTRRTRLPGKSQADLIVGAAGPIRQSPDFLTASLGNHILGQFGLMGRIGRALREDAGLAYYASSSLGGGEGPGPWEAVAGVDPQNVNQAIELIFKELRRFTDEPVSAQELADSQANFIGRLPLSLESNAGVVGALLRLERYQLGLDYYRRYSAMVRAVTVEQVQETARRYLPVDRLAVSVAGP